MVQYSGSHSRKLIAKVAEIKRKAGIEKKYKKSCFAGHLRIKTTTNINSIKITKVNFKYGFNDSFEKSSLP